MYIREMFDMEKKKIMPDAGRPAHPKTEVAMRRREADAKGAIEEQMTDLSFIDPIDVGKTYEFSFEAMRGDLVIPSEAIAFIKIISMVAPLLGLLGTVIGMIVTFQAITLYGAGDPKMMAGGISTALVTTVLGLCVAIPTVLLHTIVSGQSRKVINVIQSQSAGIIAQHSERSA